MELNQETLLAVPIKDDEIFELLERLAATEEMFKTPVSTIRDVAELTEASPNLIARILGEMRGPDEFEKLQVKVSEHDVRIREIEQARKQLLTPSTVRPVEPREVPIHTTQINFTPRQPSLVAQLIGLAAFVVIALMMFSRFDSMSSSMIQSHQSSPHTWDSSFGSKPQMKYSTSIGDKTFNVYTDETIFQVIDGKDVEPSSSDRAEVQKRYDFAKAMGDFK